MPKVFNVTAVCIPELHYMVNIDERIGEIRSLVDAGKYFTINRARQYGKTTTLRALARTLSSEYYVISLDFQKFDDSKFQNGNVFAISFASAFLRAFMKNSPSMNQKLDTACKRLENECDKRDQYFSLMELFELISDICGAADRSLVLMVDEVDSATNNQVFLDFLAQLRAYFIDRESQPTFQSVILAGVYDVKNLQRKIRPEEDHKINSPWNIAVDFDVDMSLSRVGIAGMLQEYESDYHTGMDIACMTNLLYDYTSGYPFLVSRLCQLMDTEVSVKDGYGSKSKAWTKNGFQEAVRMILSERNTLFESLTGKLADYPELNSMLQALLFSGKNIVYNFYEPAINVATMFGFVKNSNGSLMVANRIFDTWLYNLYLAAGEMRSTDIYKASLQDKNQFIIGGRLNMKLILEKFVIHFHDLYSDSTEKFIEDEGRKYFLLYLRPIINGTGNYYIESRTRDLRRTDVILDYRGEQYVIEMKIWHGNEYNERGEKQLVGYMDDYHTNKGYMVSFNFNKKKQIGVKEVVVGEKVLVEAVV